MKHRLPLSSEEFAKLPLVHPDTLSNMELPNVPDVIGQEIDWFREKYGVDWRTALAHGEVVGERISIEDQPFYIDNLFIKISAQMVLHEYKLVEATGDAFIQHYNVVIAVRVYFELLNHVINQRTIASQQNEESLMYRSSDTRQRLKSKTIACLDRLDVNDVNILCMNIAQSDAWGITGDFEEILRDIAHMKNER